MRLEKARSLVAIILSSCDGKKKTSVFKDYYFSRTKTMISVTSKKNGAGNVRGMRVYFYLYSSMTFSATSGPNAF